MKKIFLLIFLLIFIVRIYSSEVIKVLILPFENYSNNENTGIYSKMIQETIITDLTKLPSKIEKNEFEKEILKKLKNENDRLILLSYFQLDINGKYYIRSLDLEIEDLKMIESIFTKSKFKKFIPVLVNELDEEKNITDYKDIYKKAFYNGIDLIIHGFYFTNNGKIVITFKILDVITERSKIVFTKSGTGEYKTFDIILDSSRDFIQKMYDNIIPYPENISLRLKEKQNLLIIGEEKERFIIFNIGVLYNGGVFINKKNYNINNVDLQNKYNIYSNSVSPTFNFEIYGNYKKNYYGFGFSFIIPFIYFLPNLHMYSNVSIDFLFGYKKEFFFSWGIKLIYLGFNKYANDGVGKEFDVFYMGIGFSFVFKYLPKKYPFLIEAGICLIPPKFPYISSNNSPGPVFWNINTGYVNEANWVFPVIFQFGAGYFFKDNMGIYLRTHINFLNVCYEHYIEDESRVVIYGEDFSIFYDIEFGIIIKGIFK